MTRTAIVTGGSGGIGRCTAAALAAAGCRVYELSRHERPQPGVTHLAADVTDFAQVRAAVDEVLAREGRVDILVCNAGFGISGAAELTSAAGRARAAGAEPLRHGQRLPGRDTGHALAGRRAHSLHELHRRHPPHTLPALVLRIQGRHKRLRPRPAKRAAALRHLRLCGHARRHPLRLHRRAQEDRRGGPLRRPRGAQRAPAWWTRKTA